MSLVIFIRHIAALSSLSLSLTLSLLPKTLTNPTVWHARNLFSDARRSDNTHPTVHGSYRRAREERRERTPGSHSKKEWAALSSPLLITRPSSSINTRKRKTPQFSLPPSLPPFRTDEKQAKGKKGRAKKTLSDFLSPSRLSTLLYRRSEEERGRERKNLSSFAPAAGTALSIHNNQRNERASTHCSSAGRRGR